MRSSVRESAAPSPSVSPQHGEERHVHHEHGVVDLLDPEYGVEPVREERLLEGAVVPEAQVPDAVEGLVRRAGHVHRVLGDEHRPVGERVDGGGPEQVGGLEHEVGGETVGEARSRRIGGLLRCLGDGERPECEEGEERAHVADDP